MAIDAAHGPGSRDPDGGPAEVTPRAARRLGAAAAGVAASEGGGVRTDGQALHDEVRELLDAVGPRPSCSAAERQLGQALAARWGAFADRVDEEAFSCHPDAFLGFIPPASAATLFALGALGAGQPVIAGVIGLAVAVVTVAELLLYVELVDPLFSRAEGVNVAARVRPTGEVRQRVLLTAHQDSAWEFNVWYWFKGYGVLVNVLGLGACLLPTVVGALSWADRIGPDAVAGAAWVGAALAPFVAVHLFFHTRRAVPGAMDDLAGIVAVGAVGRALAEARLTHTEVVLMACSAEECGLRGAKRYAAAHAAEHAAVPTVDVNVDGVYDERFFTVVTRELTTGVRHDPELVDRVARLAEARGLTCDRNLIPFGATDASAFGQAGLRTVALLCQDSRRLVENYHTRLDTLDRVRPASLVAVRDVVLDLVRSLDADVGGSASPGGLGADEVALEGEPDRDER